MTINDIQIVQVMGEGYLVNSVLHIHSNSDMYSLVQAWIADGNTPEPAPVDPLANAKAEIARIAAAIPQGITQITLNDDGEAVIVHNIGSLWYSVFIQAIGCNMPNVYAEKAVNSFSILAGKKNEDVIYRIEALLPPTGSENLIFLEP